jgi:hypothetical protein
MIGEVFTSAIMGAQVAVAGSLPHGKSSVSSSGLSTTGWRSSSIPIFGSGTTGVSSSRPLMIVIPSKSSGFLVVGAGTW